MDFIYEIWQTISKNKTRSLMTAFGVFWGVLMLVLLMGGGNAIKQVIFSEFNGMSSNAGNMWTQPTSVPYAGFQSGREWNIFYSDIPVLRQKVNSIAALSPGISAGTLTIANGTHHGSYTVEGITPDIRIAQKNTICQGRDISELDQLECRKVCVIGSQVKKVIFPDTDNPVGQYITCGSMYMQVVGVLKEESSGWLSGANEQVQVPLTTLQKTMQIGDKIHYLAVVSTPDVPAKQTIEEISTVLKQLHNISPEDKKAVGYWDFSSFFTIINTLTMGVYALIWLIGLGTLFSGAVGVTNIMLVTVRERTKEIGVRRAIGSSPWLIARQIIAESIVLTSVAGIIGIMVGVGLLALGEQILEHMQTKVQELQVSFFIAVICLIIIVIIGALAGLMPALRALKIKPIEALNEE